ncbi:MAG: U32 family peptidase, partial [Bacilli bacterium]
MKKIELLSPAGDKESFISAINNGADAIYIAGTKFGARAYITNFSNEEISELIRYAHGLDVKVYVTVNTLIKNSEIQECLEFVDFLYKNSVDAILIQDIGLACILRNIFPKLPLHASTQMNVMTVGEAKRLKAEGFERIVLARECPIQTIIDIKAQVDIELEVFAHGALCMSYSGNCYMSSLIGKRSGNRGRCAGACRMEYTLTDLTDDIGTKYFLSTKDLCTLDKINEFEKAGLDSIKLEGRVKRPEYVGLVTKSYRNALDHKLDYQDSVYKIKEMFNREFTKGHIFNEDNNNFTNTISPNHQGVEIGKVIRITSRVLFVRLFDKIRIKDSVRIVSDDITDACTFYNIKNDNNNNFRELGKGDVIQIDTHENFVGQENIKILKTTDSYLIDQIDRVPRKQLPISGVLKEEDNKATLYLNYKNITVKSISKNDVEDSKTSQETRLIEQVKKTGNSNFYFEKIDSYFKDKYLPIKEINELRREALQKLEEALITSYHKEYEKCKFKISVQEFTNETRLYVKVRNLDQYHIALSCGVKYILTENKDLVGLENVIYMNNRVGSSNPGVTQDGLVSGVYKNIFNLYNFSCKYYVTDLSGNAFARYILTASFDTANIDYENFDDSKKNQGIIKKGLKIIIADIFKGDLLNKCELNGKKCKIKKIVLSIKQDNQISRKVAESNNFKYDIESEQATLKINDYNKKKKMQESG